MIHTINTVLALIVSVSIIHHSHGESNTDMNAHISHLQTQWAEIKYQIANKEEKIKKIRTLEEKAKHLVSRYPQQAEPQIWQGIILSTDAGITQSISSLGKLKKARKLFLASLKYNDQALQGSAYTSLGSLYYQAPSWPISFGNHKKAEKYLLQALAINPNGIDPNFFYGDFLLQQQLYKEAQDYLTHALKAPPRSGRELADEGRRQEIRAALAKIPHNIDN